MIERALAGIEAGGMTSVVRVSSLRETDPVGYRDQPKFLNGVAMVETIASPRELLRILLEVEARLGRDRDSVPPGGARTIDLDLLLYGDQLVDEPGLQVPHPRMHERRFVLEPLAELDPDLVVPQRGAVSALLARLE